MSARERWLAVDGKKWMDTLRLYKIFRAPPRHLERMLSKVCPRACVGPPAEASAQAGLWLNSLRFREQLSFETKIGQRALPKWDALCRLTLH